jgi:CRP/FNR family transcriptional regulator
MHIQSGVAIKLQFSQLIPETFKGAKADKASQTAAVQQRVRPGQTLFAEGDDAGAVFELAQGIVKLYKLLPDGRRQITGFATTGSLIGFTGGDIYQYSAEAVTDVVASRYSSVQFNRLLDEAPGFARRVLAIRQNDFVSAQDQMVLLGRKTAAERIATFLLHLSALTGNGMRTSGFHIPMSRSDIADYLGLTIETVSRTLTKLKRDRIISLPEALEVRIVNRDRLEEIAEGDALEAA